MTRIISLTGGREGVGKTTICMALAERLAAAGLRVCVLALVRDTGLAGSSREVATASTISDILSGKACGNDPLVSLPQGYDLVVGSDTDSWLRWLSPDRLEAFTNRLRELGDHDFVLVDAGTGLSQNQLAFSLACPELLVVLTPEPAVLADTYTLLKLLYAEQYPGTINVLVNKSADHAVGQQTFTRFGQIAGRYLDLGLRLAGVIGNHRDFAPSAGGADAVPDAQSELETLADHLRASSLDSDSVPIDAWCRNVLRAVGPSDAEEGEVATLSTLARSPTDNELQQQLARLTGRIDELIAEVDRLRGQDAPEHVGGANQADGSGPGGGLPESLANLAERSERLTFDDQNVVIHGLDRSDGREQFFAWHSGADDGDAPASSGSGAS